MFGVIQFSKQFGIGNINTIQCFLTKSYTYLAYLAYHNKKMFLSK